MYIFTCSSLTMTSPQDATFPPPSANSSLAPCPPPWPPSSSHSRTSPGSSPGPRTTSSSRSLSPRLSHHADLSTTSRGRTQPSSLCWSATSSSTLMTASRQPATRQNPPLSDISLNIAVTSKTIMQILYWIWAVIYISINVGIFFVVS